MSLSVAKFPAGPMIGPKPGPMFASAVAAPDTDVMMSSPVSPSATENSPSMSTKVTKKIMTDPSTSSDTGCPS